MSIYVGTDIEAIARFKTQDERFFELVYTDKERQYCESKGLAHQHYAARFCAKEAVIKALGTMGIAAVNFNLIEVVHAKNGAPEIVLHVEDTWTQDLKVAISMAHCLEYATATAIIHKETAS